MDLRQMRYFLTVAEEGHFGRAAQRLNIVQPALSMQIKSLEEEIGGSLFLRTSRKVELTEAGRLFRREAGLAVAQAERAKTLVQRSLRGETGRVRIGFAGNAVFTGKLLADMRTFSAAYPQVELELREMGPQLQGQAIMAGEIDVGYCPEMGFDVDDQLSAERVGDWPMMIAMASDHPLAAQPFLTTGMIAAEPLVVYATEGAADAGQLAQLRQALGAEPNISHRVSSTLSVLILAAAGQGLAMVPATFEQVPLPGLLYKPLHDFNLRANMTILQRKQESTGAVLAWLALSRPDLVF
ncbi:LysR substrate-binding domain-containing protein [Ewingella americana]